MRLRLLFITLLFCCTTLFAADSPFSGTWKLNLEKGHIIPPAPKSMTVHVENDGDNFKLHNEIVDDKGTTSIVSFDAKVDGKDYPVTGDPMVDLISIQRINDHKIKLTVKKDGKLVGTQTVTVSKDGQTTTTDDDFYMPDGKEQKGAGVYDKQ